MSVTLSRVHDIFKSLVAGNGSEFFAHVADNVDWTVEGTHPLAGHYQSKADFLSHTFEKLAKALPRGTQLQVQHALVSGDWAVVELRSLASARACSWKRTCSGRNGSESGKNQEYKQEN
jgi:uncharacterized protein